MVAARLNGDGPAALALQSTEAWTRDYEIM